MNRNSPILRSLVPPALACSLLASCGPGTVAQDAARLVVHPDPVVIGRVEVGLTAKAGFVLRNPGRVDVILSRFEAGCPCVRVEPASVRIGPGESQALSVHFDPSEDPEFRGGLTVALVGRDGHESEIFRTSVTLHVGG